MSQNSSQFTIEGEQTTPFTIAFSALGRAGLHPCLIRADADAATWADELDVLVRPVNLRATLRLLHDLGWEVLNTGLFAPSRHHLLHWWSDRFLKLDLYSKIVSGGLEYIDTERYLAGASLVGDVYVPSAGNWLVHVTVNAILEKPRLRDDYRPRIEQALEDRAAVQHAEAEAARLGLSHLFGGDRRLDFLFDEARVTSLRAGMREALLTARAVNKARLLWDWAINKFGKNLALRSGFSIAVVGPDGAGKTTFLAELESVLDWHGMRTSTVYMGPWDQPVLPSSKALERLGAVPLDIGPDSPARKTAAKLAKAHLRRILYYANFLPEMWSRYFLRVWPAILERRVVLLDRHAIDLQVGFHNEPMRNAAWLRRLLVRLSPRPSMLILLDNDAEVIWRRKKEFPLVLIQSALAGYRQAARTYGMVVIRTDRPPEQLVGELIERRWRDFVRLRRDGVPFLRRK